MFCVTTQVTGAFEFGSARIVTFGTVTHTGDSAEALNGATNKMVTKNEIKILIGTELRVTKLLDDAKRVED